jgi:hypothetical protein
VVNYSGFPPLPHISTGDWRDKDNLLYKVWSIKKKNEIFQVLQNPNATHFERLWLVGFLKWVGYDFNHVLNIIHNLNKWEDYNKNITTIQVRSVFSSSHYDSRPYRSKPAGTLKKRVHSSKIEAFHIDIPPEPCLASSCLKDRELVKALRDYSIQKSLLKYLQIIELIDILEKDKSPNPQKEAPAERGRKSSDGKDSSSLHSSRFLTKRGGA